MLKQKVSQVFFFSSELGCSSKHAQTEHKEIFEARSSALRHLIWNNQTLFKEERTTVSKTTVYIAFFDMHMHN